MLLSYLLTLVVVVLFVVVVIVIVKHAEFREPYAHWTMWAAGFFAIVYLVLMLAGEVPTIPVGRGVG